MRHNAVLALFFLLLGTLPAAGSPLTKEEIELEKERLRLERERLQLERERLEFERLKAMRQTTPPAHRQPTATKKSRHTRELYLGCNYHPSGTVTRTRSLNGTDTEYDGTIRGYGVTFGFGTFDENRFEITYNNLLMTLDREGTEWDVSIFSLDYLFVYDEAFGEHLSPFIKLGLATARSANLDDTLKSMGYTVGGDGTVGGAGLRLGIGLFYLLDERLELSLGVDNTGISWSDTTLEHSGGTDKLELYDSIDTTYLGLSYRF